MACSENENVCSVQKENNLGYYRLHTIWKTNGFNINITSKDGAWRGEMNCNDIEKMCTLLEMDSSTYLKECKKALTTHDGLPGMSYTIDNGCFEWKKIIDEDQGIKRKMGFIKVQSTDFVENIQNFVTVALRCNKALEAELRKNQDLLEKTRKEKQELLNKLDELINIKNTMENDLYSKFILLLNSKKSKIRELKNSVTHKNIEKNETNISLSNPYEIDTEDEGSCSMNFKGEALVTGKKFCKREKTTTEKEKKKIKKEKKGKKSTDSKLTLSGKKNDSISSSDEVLSSKTQTAGDFTDNGIPSTQEDMLNYFFGS